ncbi:methyl-accepting chemotaxis protein [Desulfosporosinus acidiphilus SJ4]|uniref:Methyl-accepting chemotaxis protein n=1 Tax=Desulfosporosinus acidiphilus (strain DSM 22704 / JCM 16185 / SJ4) TaxID=646529 RepID=I4D9L4_DESAJ|nr:methyl-accepting chemotaxis protein [Desulfosporosinus acidiphilus]AFM42488.1 methyl-accepting chemotaxis protein [Desulfosporosinus acidiphilus SJ4]
MLEDFVQIMQMLYDADFGKSSVLLYDLEKYIVIKEGSVVKFPLKEGDKLLPGSATHESVITGKKVTRQNGAELLGFPYYSIAYPLTLNGEVIGGIAIGSSAEKEHAQEKLQALAQNLSSSLQQVSAAIENIAASAQVLADMGQSVTVSSQNVNEKALQMEEVVEYINSVASDTKLLGLNASIEAARAGEVGRGFAVVASEIRAMAISSATSAKDIRKIIVGIQEVVGRMTKELEKSGENTQEVSAAIEEIGATVESLTQSAIELASLSEKL